MNERIAIIDGIRTPLTKAGDILKSVSADGLGVTVVKEILARTEIDPKLIDEVVIGNVAQPANAANIARVIAIKAGIPIATPAMTVHRNCASGFEAITTSATKLLANQSNIIVAGGTESMSNIPLLYNAKMTSFFENLMKAKSLSQRLRTLLTFRLSHLKPVIGVLEGLTDPTCGLIMGLTAENLSREFQIGREEQDKYALNSHQKAVSAIENQILAQEIVPIPIPPTYQSVQEIDIGPRKSQSLQALAKLRPYFDRKNGTVTVGNSCPLTDGAAAVLLMRESQAKAEGYKPLGYLRDFAYAGLDPHRMGLGPVYATSKLLQRVGLSMAGFDLVEMNEAFAAQAIACVKAFESDSFSKTYLNQDKAVGAIDPDKLNVNGGAIALGHPVGTTGTRLVITLLKELKRRQLNRGLATLCVGGGQGGSLIVEVN